jgi:hypothetical protein
MRNSDMPCGWEPCEKNEIVELDDILINIANHKYESATPIFDSQNTLIMNEPILKFKNLGINGNTSIEFELYNDYDYYALVIDELSIQNGTKEEKEILFKWYDENFDMLYAKLQGDRGLDAKPPIGKGAHGLPGGKGIRGGTRHSPTIFIFIKTLKLTTTSLEDISFEFKLKGIPGAWGGNGGNGSDGNEGIRGSNGEQAGLFHPCSSGRDGKSGGQPGRGGQGGNGGCGGNGPDLIILVDQIDLWEILERSKYDVSGADPFLRNGGDNQPGNGGAPGKAGAPGIGGDGGRRAGSCNGGARGPSGMPMENTREWRDWNLGFGLPGTAGIDGSYDFDEFQEIYKIVFNDPDIQTIEE